MNMMMIKGRRDIRPLLVKFGVALAISFAGYLYSRVRTKRIKPPDFPPSDSDRKVDYEGRLKIKEDPQPEMDSVSIDTYDKPCIGVRVDNPSMNTLPGVRCSGDKEGLLLPEFDQLVREFDMNTAYCVVTSPKADVETFNIKKEQPKSIRSFERDDYEQEIENLKNRIRFLRERERKLEVQLLEYYGVKEQESVLMELQNRLKLNNIEAKLFSMRIESLEADNKRLEAQVADHSKIVCELEAAKMKIKQLKRKIRHEAEQSKEQILELAQRVGKLRCPDHETGNSGDSDVHSEVQTLKDLEHEAEELRKFNEKLQQENGDLSQRLESTQILANSILEDPEREELCKEMLHLREENENLANEMERLQSNRCADAEELVYLRWVNACLRYELRNYQPPPGKTIARDLSKSLSPNSERKAKQLILQYANTEDGDKEPSIVDFDFDHDQWPSSQPSYLTDDHEDSPCSSSTKKHHSKKMKFFAKLRRLIRGKYGYHHHHHHHHHQSGQGSPIIRSLSVDDIGRKFSYESPHHNSCGGEIGTDDQRSESQSPMLASLSQNSNNSSLEYQPLTTLAEEDAKDIKSANTPSDSGSPRGGVRFVLGRGSTSSSPLDYRPEPEAEDGQREELVKYAEALRDSRWIQRTHKKSASFSVG